MEARVAISDVAKSASMAVVVVEKLEMVVSAVDLLVLWGLNAAVFGYYQNIVVAVLAGLPVYCMDHLVSLDHLQC